MLFDAMICYAMRDILVHMRGQWSPSWYVVNLLCYIVRSYALMCYTFHIHACTCAVNDRYRDMLWCAVLCYTMLCYAMLCYAMICDDTLHIPYLLMKAHAAIVDHLQLLTTLMLCYAMLCYAILCYDVLWQAVLSYVAILSVMLCYAMLCYVMLCHAMLNV